MTINSNKSPESSKSSSNIEQSNFFMILTHDVMFSKKIGQTEKLLFGYITSLTHSKGYCWSSNSHFGEMFDLSKGQICKCISKLKNAGFITTEIIKDCKKQIIGRKIYTSLNKKPSETTIPLPSPDDYTPIVKNDYTPIVKNDYYNSKEVKSKYTMCTPTEMHAEKPSSKPKKKPAIIEYSKSFEEFWEIYLNKKGKKSAFIKWKARIKEGHKAANIIRIAKMYMKFSEDHNKKQFIVMAQRFLLDMFNDEGYLAEWEDKVMNEIKKEKTEERNKITFDWYKFLSDKYPSADIERTIERLKQVQGFAYAEVVEEQIRRSS